VDHQHNLNGLIGSVLTFGGQYGKVGIVLTMGVVRGQASGFLSRRPGRISGGIIMRYSVLLASLFTLLVSFAAFGATPTIDLGNNPADIIFGGNPQLNKSARDTFVLIGPWGSGAQVNGQFQDPAGTAAWNGWTHRDVTQPDFTHWQISDYHAANLGEAPHAGNLAAWCGKADFPACSDQDEPGGYGNNWIDQMDWLGTVQNPDLPVAVNFSAFVNLDTEPGYDWVYFQYLTDNGPVNLQPPASGYFQNYALVLSFTLSPQDYRGENGDQVHLRLLFESDIAWSDIDCLFPSTGAIQIDDIQVSLTQGDWQSDSFTDFESGWGDWNVSYPLGVGDFAQVWSELQDRDPCSTNYSPQVAFIDDGLVVPGVGPSYCMDWCYGPNGYVVNTTGGRLGPDHHLYNVVESPILEWPADEVDGFSLQADAYMDIEFDEGYTGLGMNFGIRSIVDNGVDPVADQMAAASWQISNYWYYGAPLYVRFEIDVGQYLVPNRTHVQFQMICAEFGWAFGYDGNNSSPAPYVDNVRMIAHPHFGPQILGNGTNQMHDAFPASGEVDLVNLGNNSIAPVAADGRGVRCTVESIRSGAELVGPPELHFNIDQNPIFDPYRTNSEYGGSATGVAIADSAYTEGGVVIPNMWEFTLPESHFLFPGDVLHYFIAATDGGPGLEDQTVYLPADTSGYSNFVDPFAYDEQFTARGLPSVQDNPLNPGQLIQPSLLVVDGDRTTAFSLTQLGMVLGRDFDWQANGDPTPDVQLVLAQYKSIIIRSLFPERRDAIDAWLRTGGKDLLLAKNNVVSDLMQQEDGLGVLFVDDWLKVTYFTNDLRPLIENQGAPLVRTIPGNEVFADDFSWIAYGSCPDRIQFDALAADQGSGGMRLAEFTSPAGAGGQYSYTAATMFHHPNFDSRVISLPFAIRSIYTTPEGGKINAPLAARSRLLEQVLGFFGIEGDPQDVTPVTEAPRFAVRCFPNPFNPQTTIEYYLAKPGHLSLKVFNLRGQLVRTLVDEFKEESGFVLWDGKDAAGAQAASGVYLFEARSGGAVKVEKMVMLK
jgi:hypothetical protein